MTAKCWKISEAKSRFSELVSACEQEPQVLFSRGKPVAAVIDMESFAAYQSFQIEAKRPSIAALLAELDGINREEEDFGEPPKRTNRPQPEIH